MYKGLEGARGWLAWTVVVSHIVLLTGLSNVVRQSYRLVQAGHYAVGVFIIISGFVITNLVLTKNEPYGLYIARRFLRIYPAYFVCLMIGIVVFPMYQAAAATTLPYMTPAQAQQGAARIAELGSHFWRHLGAHITLLHGALPDNVLYDSQYMFLGPAWSLSLEWQFYLIAPLAVWLLRGRYRLLVVLATVFGYVAYRRQLFGEFNNPSFLPGAGLLFLLGMATRLGIEQLPRFKTYPLALAVGFATLGLFSRELVPIAVWLAITAYLRTDGRWEALDGGLARWAGERSYSVYILHQPVVHLAVLLSYSVLHLTIWPAVALTGVTTLVVTAIGSEMLFRVVESPINNFGRRLGRRTSLAVAPSPAE